MGGLASLDILSEQVNSVSKRLSFFSYRRQTVQQGHLLDLKASQEVWVVGKLSASVSSAGKVGNGRADAVQESNGNNLFTLALVSHNFQRS